VPELPPAPWQAAHTAVKLASPLSRSGLATLAGAGGGCRGGIAAPRGAASPPANDDLRQARPQSGQEGSNEQLHIGGFNWLAHKTYNFLGNGFWAIIRVLPRQAASTAANSREAGDLITVLQGQGALSTHSNAGVQPTFRDRPTMTSASHPNQPQPPPGAPAQDGHGLAAHGRFLTTAPELEHLPRVDVPEIAFVGRSNAGKSTCINTLTQQKRLAFASKTPGRTQSINLFSLGKQGVTDAVLADLPGYGYAAVPKADKYRWQQVMANYLQTRDNLAAWCCCATRAWADRTRRDPARRDPPARREGLKFLVLLTKSDKLNRTEAAKALSIARLQTGGGEVKLFSALKRQGVEEVAQLLWDWAHGPSRPGA
jgi:GTP-binding protein